MCLFQFGMFLDLEYFRELLAMLNLINDYNLKPNAKELTYAIADTFYSRVGLAENFMFDQETLFIGGRYCAN
ncbi:hypothetical protein K0B04_03325 [Patescibacteria group bacterium]|nr:hypothetical protein [Patescibacteria group bacterium]